MTSGTWDLIEVNKYFAEASSRSSRLRFNNFCFVVMRKLTIIMLSTSFLSKCIQYKLWKICNAMRWKLSRIDKLCLCVMFYICCVLQLQIYCKENFSKLFVIIVKCKNSICHHKYRWIIYHLSKFKFFIVI